MRAVVMPQRVLRQPMLRRCGCGGATHQGGECSGCRKKRLHRTAWAPAPDVAPPSVHAVLASPGRALEPSVRGRMEDRLGHDLSRVRIHADAESAQAADDVGARAWAVGNRIAFGAGQYRPGTSDGDRLLAHELAHTLQGDSSPTGGSIAIGAVDDPAEHEAERLAALDAPPAGRSPLSPSARRVRRLPRGGDRTNWAVDTNHLTAAHLGDPDVITALEAMPTEELERRAREATDLEVAEYLESLIERRLPSACTREEHALTQRQAEAARLAVRDYVVTAQRQLDRLHSAYVTNKREIRAGEHTLSGEAVCAFVSSFNIEQTDPEFGVRQIQVSSRLRAVERALNRPSTYVCAPPRDPHCRGSGPDMERAGYVINNRPPIYLCATFREAGPIVTLSEAIVLHEFMHLLPGVHDAGGYAMPAVYARTCRTRYKFTASSDVLANTADALTSFVLHAGMA